MIRLVLGRNTLANLEQQYPGGESTSVDVEDLEARLLARRQTQLSYTWQVRRSLACASRHWDSVALYAPVVTSIPKPGDLKMKLY